MLDGVAFIQTVGPIEAKLSQILSGFAHYTGHLVLSPPESLRNIQKLFLQNYMTYR